MLAMQEDQLRGLQVRNAEAERLFKVSYMLLAFKDIADRQCRA
jgi:hypothetical protein